MKFLGLLITVTLLARANSQAGGPDITLFVNGVAAIEAVQTGLSEVIASGNEDAATVSQLESFSNALERTSGFMTAVIDGVNNGELDTTVFNNQQKTTASELATTVSDTITAIITNNNPTIVLDSASLQLLETDLQALSISIGLWNNWLVTNNNEITGDREPHFMFVRGNQRFCFDFTGEDGEVIQLVSDITQQIYVNGQLFSPGVHHSGTPINTYFSDAAFMIGDYVVYVNRDNITLNGFETLDWEQRDESGNGRLRVRVTEDNVVRITIGEIGAQPPIAFAVYRHEGAVVGYYLGVQLKVMHGLSDDTTGLLGEFRSKNIDVSGDITQVENLGTLFDPTTGANLSNKRLKVKNRFNTDAGVKSTCWFDDTFGSILLNCNHADYFVASRNVFHNGPIFGTTECQKDEEQNLL